MMSSIIEIDPVIEQNGTVYAGHPVSLLTQEIENRVKPYLHLLGSTCDVECVQVPGRSVLVHGKKDSVGDVRVFLTADFYSLDPDACGWLIKNQIARTQYIYHSTLTSTLLQSFSAMVAEPRENQRLGMIPGLLVACIGMPLLGMAAVVDGLVNGVFYVLRSHQADNFTIEHSSDQELLGARRFFKAVEQAEKTQHEIFNGVFWRSFGDSHLYWMGPGMQGRVAKIEKALVDRGVVLDEGAEREKVEQIAQCIESQDAPAHARRFWKHVDAC